MLGYLKRKTKDRVRAVAVEESTRLHETVPELVQDMIDRSIKVSPVIAAKAVPLNDDSQDLFVGLPTGAAAADGAEPPLPPKPLWGVDMHYVEGGKHNLDQIRRCLAEAGVPLDSFDSILEFGCGTGRLLRHLLPHAREHEVWGVDLDANRIAWAQQHLSPPLRFSTCSSLPHLPFEDGSFGFILAGSVFTHIAEFADAWLLELRRVTRPGGYLYLTIQDQSWVEAMRDRGEDERDWLADLLDQSGDVLDRLGRDAAVVTLGRADKVGGAQVVHDRVALVENWNRVLEVVQVFDRSFYEQTAVLLRKRPG